MGSALGMSGTAWRTPSVAIERIEVPAGLRLSGHGHDVPHLCFLETGVFDERHGGGHQHVDGGTLRSSPAGDEHDLVFRADSRCLLVLIHDDPAAVASRMPDERRYYVTPRLNALTNRLSRNLVHSASPLHVEIVVLELLAATMPEVREHRAAAPPPWLKRVRDRLHSEPAAPPTTFELAAEAGYHPVYVARAFRQYYGIGLSEYARAVRVEWAHELLTTTDLPISQIALRAGYADQSHLTRSMRRVLRETPARIRRNQGRTLQVASIQESESRAS